MEPQLFANTMTGTLKDMMFHVMLYGYGCESSISSNRCETCSSLSAISEPCDWEESLSSSCQESTEVHHDTQSLLSTSNACIHSLLRF